MRTRTYLTGGMGSRHRDEAFGDPFELPPDRAYAETCAAIASVMLAWRLLLATGDPSYADAIDRAMYNGVLSGPRAAWYPCACCPPNLMRLLSSWPQYLATTDDTGVQLHQYATGEIAAEVAGEAVRLAVRTDYPWHGRIEVRVLQTPDRPWKLSLRVPHWSRSATLTTSDGDLAVAPGEGLARQLRPWRAGDRVVLTLDLPVRVTEPDPRIDAVRGCVAVERGPLVYCVESADAPAGVELEELIWDGARPPVAALRPDLGEAVVGVRIPVVRRGRATDPLTAGAIPYFAWANRRVEAMRVWIPR